MSIIDRFKDIVGIEDIDEEEYEEEVQAARKTERRPEVRRSVQPRYERDNKVIEMQNKPMHQTKPMKLVVIEPSSFDECPKLVDSLKSRKPLIINLEKVESDTARKVFDFLSGAAYALNGNVQKVANNIFIFAPENVDIADGMEKTNFEFGAKPGNSWR